ncbi:MAG: hypothetical protein K1X28_07075 [Parachlamydiales bacterium]|nr:hypothetical protein [Parachlamydiales bacterium]
MRAICSSFLLLIGSLMAQESEEIAKTSFPVRLTPEEEAGQVDTVAPCCPPEPSCKPKCCEPNNRCPGIVFEKPCYSPGPYFFGDWLFWKTVQSGMQYATKYNPSSGDMLNAKTRSFELGWHSGGRIGARYDIPYDYCDAVFSFSHLCPETSQSTNGPLFPYLMYQGSLSIPAVTIVNQAFGKWRVNFNAWELEFGRKMIASDHFMLRPHAGIKGAWIHQKTKVYYLGTPLQPSDRFDIKMKDRFNGFGLRGGFDSIWTIDYGFSVFGNLAAALLWGTFNIHQTQTFVGIPSIDWKDNFNAARPVVEAKLGFSWDWRYYHDRFLVGIDAAWEMQYWWGQNVYDRFTSAELPTSVKTDYDLAFYGLTLGIKLGF